MQQSSEFLAVDVVLEFSQNRPDQISEKDHLGFKGADDGEQDGFESPENF